MEKRHLYMVSHIFHGLQGVTEVCIAAYQYGGVVSVPKSVHQHINGQFDVDAFLIGRVRWPVAVHQVA